MLLCKCTMPSPKISIGIVYLYIDIAALVKVCPTVLSRACCMRL